MARLARPMMWMVLGWLVSAGTVFAQQPPAVGPEAEQPTGAAEVPPGALPGAPPVPVPPPEGPPAAAPAPAVTPLPAPAPRPRPAGAPSPLPAPSARPGLVPGAAPGDKKVAMNFKEAELEAVIKFISELTGKNFILDEKVKGKVTVISPGQLTVDEAYEVFQAILGVKGFTIVPAGKVFKVVFTREAKQTNIETVRESAAPPGDRFVTRILPLKFVAVESISGVIAPLVSKDGSVVAYGATNTLIITDAYSNIERLAEIIQALDVETVDTVLEIIPIRYASADTITKSLVQAVTGKARPQARTRAPAAAGAQVQVQAQAEAVKIISDARTNSLIVIADPQSLADIKTMIRALDVEIPKGTGKINVYYLKYADAEGVTAVLTAISKTAGPKPRPGLPQQPGQPGQPAAAAARGPAEITIDLEEPVQITSDKATNSLVIIATPQDFELLKTVIAKLDIRRPQVLVEAMIIEMSYDKSLQLGVEWRSTNDPTAQGVNVIGGTNFGQIAGVATATNPLAAIPPGLFLGAIDGTITFRGTEFINVAALVNALQKTGDVNVLSTPHLLTTDNEEAEIIVSDNIPFQTSQKFDNNGQPIFTFDYKDVGLTLRLTPQINEEDYVKLKLFQEISQVVSATTGTGSLAPSTTKRSAKTTVIVKDSTTVVIGGLIKDDNQKNASSVPCLGDIPLIGYLFKNWSDRTIKTNLLVFLTPHIIRNAEDMESISRSKRHQFEENVENPAKGPKTTVEKLRRYSGESEAKP